MASHCDALCGNLLIDYNEGDHDHHDYTDKEEDDEDDWCIGRIVGWLIPHPTICKSQESPFVCSTLSALLSLS